MRIVTYKCEVCGKVGRGDLEWLTVAVRRFRGDAQSLSDIFDRSEREICSTECAAEAFAEMLDEVETRA